jgi:hypothetical protein
MIILLVILDMFVHFQSCFNVVKSSIGTLMRDPNLNSQHDDHSGKSVEEPKSKYFCNIFRFYGVMIVYLS